MQAMLLLSKAFAWPMAHLPLFMGLIWQAYKARKLSKADRFSRQMRSSPEKAEGAEGDWVNDFGDIGIRR